MYDERKEGTQNQISAHAVGSGDYHTHSLAHVRSEMRLGDTRLLSKNTQRKYCNRHTTGIMNDFHATTISGVFEQDNYNWTTVQLS